MIRLAIKLHENRWAWAISQLENYKRMVVTTPDDLSLTDAENSVLIKGLTFVPVKSKKDEYQIKADRERYFRRLWLNDHSHDHKDLTTKTQPY